MNDADNQKLKINYYFLTVTIFYLCTFLTIF